MKSTDSDGDERFPGSQDAQKLDGFTDLGMSSEALDLAGKILRRRKPHPSEISAAIQAIGIHSKSMKSWKTRVAKLVARLPKKTRHAVREDLLVYFSMIGDHETAVSFISAPGRFSSGTIFMALKSLIGLGKHSEAILFARKYLRQFTVEDDAFNYEANAVISGIEGNHFEALYFRLNSPIEGALESDIVAGLLESLCAFVVTQLKTRVERLKGCRKLLASDVTQISVPGIEEDLLIESEKRCERMIAKLTSLIRKSQRPLYNMDQVHDCSFDPADSIPPDRRSNQ